jgi:glycosyltransferase involved in cell wall biosynthesis
MKPLVSVLMVAHNPGQYLRPAVESILGQSYKHFELILVDNASTDSSIQALNSWTKDDRIKLFPHPVNLGHAGGLNIGLPHCHGNYVAIMDSDDISMPERLNRQVAELERNATLAGVGCIASTINSTGERTGREFTLRLPEDIHTFSKFDMPFIFPTLTVRRSLLNEYPFRTGILTPDLDLLNRATTNHSFAGLPETLLCYRRHNSSVTAKRRGELFASSCVVRLSGARRNSGKPENFSQSVAESTVLIQESPGIGEIFAHYARQALQEGFFFQAIWHARKLAVHGAKTRGLMLLLHILGSSRKLPLNDQRLLWRLALLGTIRAYRMNPAFPMPTK